jgi:NADP-dependent 3-hydroxy acid dehydrogenase YdfG
LPRLRFLGTSLAGQGAVVIGDHGRQSRAVGAEDIADMIAYIVTRPRHVAVNEVLIRPTEQA